MSDFKLSKIEQENLKKVCKYIRQDILKMSYLSKSAHLGGSLSCVEILVILYFKIMNINHLKPKDKNRDRLIFSKAHDSKALYAVLAKKKFYSNDLLRHYEADHRLPGHTTRDSLPGIEVSAGSLGHGLPIACGIALGAKKQKLKSQIYCILSDGELNEGSTWEAALFASHHGLDNLTAIIDYNKIQGYGFNKDTLNLEPLKLKWEAFNWDVYEINGHNLNSLHKALKTKKNLKPKLIIANTIKGFGGIKKYINTVDSHYISPTQADLSNI